MLAAAISVTSGCTLMLDTELNRGEGADASPVDGGGAVDGDAEDVQTGDRRPDDADGVDTLDEPATDGSDARVDGADASELDTASEPPPAPTGVNASDGTWHDRVMVTWERAEGATGYMVYRDGELVDPSVSSLSFEDTGAEGASPTAQGFSLEASDGTLTGRVQLSWSEPDVPAGTIHEYTVVAGNAAGASEASEGDTGFRAASPVIGYEVQIDEEDWIDVENVRAFVDDLTPPPLPAEVVSVGTVTASDGESPFQVDIELTGLEVSDAPGSTVSYRVRAYNGVGVGPASATETGYAVPTPALQWLRGRFGYRDGYYIYEAIPGATTQVWTDVGGLIGGAENAYQCEVTVAAETVTSEYDLGHRVVQTLESDTSTDRLGFRVDVSGDRAIVSEVGFPAVHFYTFGGAAEGWAEDERIAATMPEDVAIAGDWAAAGEPGRTETIYPGVVVIYRYDSENGWQEDDVLEPPSELNAASSGFGTSVDLEDDASRLIVAAPGLDAAFVFARSDDAWSFEDALDSSASFGKCADLDGDRAIVAGSDEVAIFERSGATWSSVHRSNSADLPDSTPNLGDDCAISGTWAMVGDNAVDDDGAVYVFDGSDGSWGVADTPTIVAATGPGSVAPTAFGQHLALDGDTALVADHIGRFVALLAVDRSSGEWVHRELIRSPDATYSAFADDVATDGGAVIVGASGWGDAGEGRSYAYWLSR